MRGYGTVHGAMRSGIRKSSILILMYNKDKNVHRYEVWGGKVQLLLKKKDLF